MVKKLVVFSFLFIFLLSGCATARREKDMESQGLRNEISALQAQIQSKDEEIDSLKAALDSVLEEKEALVRETAQEVPPVETKSRPKAKEIQTALRNAGYYAGRIDGRIGKQTKEAIKAFQKESNLSVDGKVGKATWELLREYLEQRVK